MGFMSISSIETNNAVNSLNLQSYIKTGTIKNISSNEISDNFTRSDDTIKFKEIVSKYDVTNMSRNEADAMYQELYDNKLINFRDLAFSTFDPTRIPYWQDGISSVSGWQISSNPDQKMNWLEGFKTQANWNKVYGNPEFQSSYDEPLALAEKIKYFQS